MTVRIAILTCAMLLPQKTHAQTGGRNVTIEPVLREVVHGARWQSPTIDSQWRTIESTPRVHVAIVLARDPLEPRTRARTAIRRYSSGLLHAVVELPAGDDYVELIAHELEHVIEQIEGVDLKALAAAGVEAVQRPSGSFETKRAQRAGVAAAAEAAAAAAEQARSRPTGTPATPGASRPPRTLEGS